MIRVFCVSVRANWRERCTSLGCIVRRGCRAMECAGCVLWYSSSTTSELRLITTMEGQVFAVALMRPRFAALRVILSLR